MTPIKGNSRLVSNKLKPLLVILILIALSGCALASTAPATVSDYCSIAKPIGYDSKRDTPRTVAEIEDHNLRFLCVCEHDCPAGR